MENDKLARVYKIRFSDYFKYRDHELDSILITTNDLPKAISDLQEYGGGIKGIELLGTTHLFLDDWEVL